VNPIELKARRLALGLSQSELAELVGVGQNAVSQWETGARRPNPGTAVVLADALDQLEDAAMDLEDELVELAEHKSALLDSPEVTLAVPEGPLPGSVRLVAWARAAAACRVELGVEATIIDAADGV